MNKIFFGFKKSTKILLTMNGITHNGVRYKIDSYGKLSF